MPPHIMELLGKTRVVVKDGKVIEVGEPEVKWCPPCLPKYAESRKSPLMKSGRIWSSGSAISGMFTDKRRLELEDFVGFGASEVMMTGLSRGGLLDTTVTACEGAGTVISNNPTCPGHGRQDVRPCRNRAYRRYNKWDYRARRNRA